MRWVGVVLMPAGVVVMIIGATVLGACIAVIGLGLALGVAESTDT
jgi:hypothetical protein